MNFAPSEHSWQQEIKVEEVIITEDKEKKTKMLAKFGNKFVSSTDRQDKQTFLIDLTKFLV